MGKECSRVAAIRLQILVQGIIHHANRRGAATGEAFDEFDAVFSVGADRDRIVHSAVVMGCRSIPAAAASFPIIHSRRPSRS